jgi:hypothetical protein
MKRDKIIYWVTTGILSAAMLMSAILYLTKSEELREGFRTLGYPEYLMGVLGIAKLLGAVVLLAPVWDNLKEWAYAGFAFVFIGATWTHVATQTPWVTPLVFLLILGISYGFRQRLKLNQK